MRILLFAGTTEGRALAEWLAGTPAETTVSVATGYGAEALEGLPDRIGVHVGRLDADSMRLLLTAEQYDFAVDATHPYAVQASENIYSAAAGSGTPYLRLLRPGGGGGECVYVDSVESAAREVERLPGNVLLTTGSKELAAYTAIPGYADRLYPRVLPTADSIRRCEALGFRRRNIIAMQGPFGKELNVALMIRFNIRALVTKDGGAEGGFFEKMEAAAECGVVPLVVGRPPQRDGVDLEAVRGILSSAMEAEA